MKFNLEEEATFERSYSSTNSFNFAKEDLSLNIYFKIGNLNNFIDEKIKEIVVYSCENNKFKSRVDWLNGWKYFVISRSDN